MFFSISKHFTTSSKISSTPTVVKLSSFHRLSRVEPWDLKMDLKSHLKMLVDDEKRLHCLENEIKTKTSMSLAQIIKHPPQSITHYQQLNLNTLPQHLLNQTFVLSLHQTLSIPCIFLRYSTHQKGYICLTLYPRKCIPLHKFL